MKTPDFTLEEVKEYLHSETHYIEAVGNFKNAIIDHIEQLEVKAKLVEQYRWERDTAIDQLKQLGVGFGEKVNGKIPRWISVEERLPEQGKCVLFTPTSQPKSIRTGRFSRKGKLGGAIFLSQDGRYKFEYYASKWMPLPEPPKEDK